MKKVPLTKGYMAIVDDADYELVSRYKWQANEQRRKDGSIKIVYAQGHLPGNKSLLMHRLILGLTDSKIQADHQDHNGLDNRRENLRLATFNQNRQNSRAQVNNTSGFKGVVRSRKKWVARIRIDGRERYLGCFAKREEAAEAYKIAAKELFGEFAYPLASNQKGK